jgi:hypothetical protein
VFAALLRVRSAKDAVQTSHLPEFLNVQTDKDDDPKKALAPEGELLTSFSARYLAVTPNHFQS